MSFLVFFVTLSVSMTREQKQYGKIFLGAVIIFSVGIWAYHTYVNRQAMNAAWPELDGGVYAAAVTRDGVTSLIPADEIYDGGAGADGIPALTNPQYASVLASDAMIADDLLGIDLELNGEHRFYPVQILNWHQVVNDSWGGREIAVTYCPLCGTGVVYDRQHNTQTLTFSVTGDVYNNNTLLADAETGSLWIQALGLAVQGEAMGAQLAVIPSRMMAWKDWKNAYPTSLVLSTKTGFTRDYTRHPYGNYDTSKGVYFPVNHMDANFTPKWVVYGVHNGTEGIGFSDIVLKGSGLVRESLDGAPIIAVYDFARAIARVFSTYQPSSSATSSEALQIPEALTFSYDFAKKRLTDNETGSVWNAEGLAVSGKMKGVQLAELPTTRGFWFCLSALHPTWRANVSIAPEGKE